MSQNQKKNAHRWNELREKYKLLRERGGNDSFRLGRLAIHLRDALIEACGCDDRNVDFYTYEHGTTPQFDRSEKVKTGWAAVSQSDTGWVFALSILLEIGPNVSPKTAVICPIDVQIDGDIFHVKTTLFTGSERINGIQPSYDADLQRVAEAMFEGLSEALSVEAKGGTRSKIGFLTVD